MIEIKEHGGVFGAGKYRKGVDVYYKELGLNHLPAVSNIIAPWKIKYANYLANDSTLMLSGDSNTRIYVHHVDGSLISSVTSGISINNFSIKADRIYHLSGTTNAYLVERDLPNLTIISQYNVGGHSLNIRGFANTTDDSMLIAMTDSSNQELYRFIERENNKWILKKTIDGTTSNALGIFKRSEDTAVSINVSRILIMNIDPLSTIKLISQIDISSLGLSINRDTPLRYGIYSEYVNGYIYVHDGKGRIIKLTETGDVLATFDDVYAVPSGLNYSADNDRFYLLSGAGDKIHELDLNLQLKKSYPLLTGNGANTFLGGPYQGDGRFITGVVNVAEIKQSRFKLGG